MKKIFVGNLPFSTFEEQLEELFGAYGKVHSVKIITDRETGRSRGFGFIEMDEADAANAISVLDGTNFEGRNIRVNEATERPPRRDRQRW